MPQQWQLLLDPWLSPWEQSHQGTCQNKAPGHHDRATHANTMGGSQANKPEDL